MPTKEASPTAKLCDNCFVFCIPPEGGHNIPQDVIVRRYYKGMQNLVNVFTDICDYWIVIDNSNTPYKFIAEGGMNMMLTIYENEIWDKIKANQK